MKHLPVVVGAVALVGLSGNSVFAKGGANASSPPPPPVHHSAGAPAVAPIGGSLPHNFSASYRPATISGNGQRTFVYPGVRNSTVHPQLHTNLNGVRTNSALQRGGGNTRSSAAVATVSKTKLDPQTSARLRNWNGNISSTAQAHQIHANNCHHHHDHDWWKHHCVAFIFFDWGWWGWYDGWWYPAWGYDPYSYYEYNEPIYGYGGLSPEQVVASVQAQLQQLGYYTYAIDGNMGPLTRSAIARYQRDHLLPITSGIDPATLGSLGIIR